MFARRKHRPQEDEPLVPHGLIWQATDEPSPDPQGIPAKHPASTPASAIEMPVRQPAPTEAQRTAHREPSKASRADSVVSNLGAISPPIAWPSPKTASVIRRPIEEINSPSVEASDSNQRIATRAQTLTNTNPQSNDPSPNLVSNASPPAAFPVHTGVVYERKVEVIELGADETRLPRSQRFKTVLALLQFFVTCATVISHGIQKCVRAITIGVRAGNQLLQVWWTATSTRAAGGLATGKQFSEKRFVAARTKAAAFVRQVRNYRVRIRIVKSPRVHGLIARSRAAWDARRENIRREPRLWESMAMAGLSAMLAIGVISGIGHYAPGADASRRDSVVVPAHNSVVHATPASQKIQRARVAAHESTAERSSKPSPLHTKAAVKPRDMIASKTKPKSNSRRIHRVSDEDDYVAPDTYHYYSNGSGSR